MANNYIYRFAENATGSNILSDSAFQSDTDRPIGHQPGIARQELENKALRSYSAISTAIAQFMANNQGTDVHDALTTTQLNSIFEAAITAAASSGPGRSLTGVTFASGVADGDVVRYDSTNNQYVAAIADGTGNDNAVGVADATNGAVFIYGRASLFSGLSAGEPYYLSTTTAGAVTSTRPSSDAVSIGVATSATDLMIGVAHLSGSVPALLKDGSVALTGPLDFAGQEIRGYTEQAAPQVTDNATIDLSAGRFFPVLLSANATIAFTNIPASGVVSFTIQAQQNSTGGYSITWPSNVTFPGGKAPTPSSGANAVDTYVGYSPDGGTTLKIEQSAKGWA